MNKHICQYVEMLGLARHSARQETKGETRWEKMVKQPESNLELLAFWTCISVSGWKTQLVASFIKDIIDLKKKNPFRIFCFLVVQLLH